MLFSSPPKYLDGENLANSWSFRVSPSDPLELALLSASACSFVGPLHLESEALSVVMNYVMTCPVSTVVRIPRSVRPLLARVLSTEFRNAISSVWGFMHLFLFA